MLEVSAVAARHEVVGGRLERQARAVTRARATVRLAAGTSKTIHLRLGSSARGIVRSAGSRGLTVTLTASVKDANRISATTTVSTTLRRARR
ncbi:MAG TPA: hypothetical protein VMU39_30225 [Solirubrobacteraceae bacterium]|nr:hypothetical protein [Solirubrobacteraceae bacterium]